MLTGMDKEALARLAHDNDVEVDKRWGKDRIIKALEDAGVKAPAKGNKLSDKVKLEPVRFVGTIGSIRVHNARYDDTTGERMLLPGLIVHFTDANGEPVGGLSRSFYPDRDEHEDWNGECDCAKCLADVRDWISADRHGLVKLHHIREALVNEPTMPMPGWNGIHPSDVVTLHQTLNFDLANAVRYEQANEKRQEILDALDAVAAEDEVEDTDILSAELEV